MRRHVGVKTEGCNTYENQEHTPQKLGCKLHSVLQVLHMLIEITESMCQRDVPGFAAIRSVTGAFAGKFTS